jgi:hypothetical protein
LSPFTNWLFAQSSRSDLVGKFAQTALADPRFPRKSWRLNQLLKYCTRPEQREAMKSAHAEWRRAR